jgi:hypothetical protein
LSLATQWLTPVIPATQEAEIRRNEVPSQPKLIVSRKYPTEKRAGRVTQGVGPEFKSQYCQEKKKRKNILFL